MPIRRQGRVKHHYDEVRRQVRRPRKARQRSGCGAAASRWEGRRRRRDHGSGAVFSLARNHYSHVGVVPRSPKAQGGWRRHGDASWHLCRLPGIGSGRLWLQAGHTRAESTRRVTHTAGAATTKVNSASVPVGRTSTFRFPCPVALVRTSTPSRRAPTRGHQLSPEARSGRPARSDWSE